MRESGRVTIEELRERLSEVDRGIIDGIAERQALVAEIGARKLAVGRPLRDFSREKAVLDGVRARAAERGLAPDLAEEVLRALIRASLEQQEHARVTATAGGSGRRALVIGGAGKMGRWFVDFLDTQGYGVEVSDPAGPVEGYAFLPVEAWDAEGGTEEAAVRLDHDLIVVSASLAVSARILERLAELRPGGLVFDVGSLKSPLRKGLAALADAGCRVTSIHPMFGPDTRLLSGRHVLFCDAGHPGATADARALFASTSAEQIEMPLDQHDRLVAYVLGLSHAVNIAFFTALADSGEAAPVLQRLSSTTFDAQLAVASRVASENPHLYYEIQSLNDHGTEALDALEQAVSRVTASVRARDEAAFTELMTTGRRYLEARA
ncbi:MAG: bifunctional chorismate mutase/prephenate dehydrogenase [Gemmatimonadales bacterium]|nr:MAG: bifunctional chorismate mutase/prephenate dehydrogenase [Gemmatimonadales bacterium]